MGAGTNLTLAKDEILFKEGDVASSLFILKKGQLRLYKEKGNGFVDLAVLRAGEVLGEMSYFDSESTRRNCSAVAMTELEFIEVSFDKFSKVIENLNPWFKTIIKTLVERLSKANQRIKSLEATASVDYSDGNMNTVRPIDLAKCLSTIFLCFKGHGNHIGDKYTVNKETLKLYATDVYNINETKLEQVLVALGDFNLLTTITEGEKELLLTEKLIEIKSLFISFNTERHLLDEKKVSVSKRCLHFLNEIYKLTQFDQDNDEFSYVSINSIMQKFKQDEISISLEDLNDAEKIGIVKPVLVDSGEYSLPVNKMALHKHIYFLRLKNYFSK